MDDTERYLHLPDGPDDPTPGPFISPEIAVRRLNVWTAIPLCCSRFHQSPPDVPPTSEGPPGNPVPDPPAPPEPVPEPVLTPPALSLLTPHAKIVNLRYGALFSAVGRAARPQQVVINCYTDHSHHGVTLVPHTTTTSNHCPSTAV
jgi:hypothetical protein